MTQIEEYQETPVVTTEGTRVLSTQVVQKMHTIIQDMQPVFQQACRNADEATQALIVRRWSEFQEAVTLTQGFNEAVMETIRQLRSQRDASVVELDYLVNELKAAATDQRKAPVYDTDPDTMELDRVEDAYRKYRPDVAELVVATEDRVNGELEYERDSFYGDAYPLIAESVISDVIAQMALHAEVGFSTAKGLMRFLRSLNANELTDDERESAQQTLLGLMRNLDE